MNNILPNEADRYHYGTIVGIGSHGYQALIHLHQSAWWIYIRQRPEFTYLSFKYIVVDKKPIVSHSTDEWLSIESQWNDIPSALFSFDSSTRLKLAQWQGEITFIISGLADDSEAVCFSEISHYFSGSLIVSVVAEPQCESDHAAFQDRIERIKPTAGCLIVNSANQIQQQIAKAVMYWPYQYLAISNILCGFVSTLQCEFGPFEFSDQRTILTHGREAKAFYLTATGADRVQRVTENALDLLVQEGWNLAVPDLTVCLWTCLTAGNMSLSEYDSIPGPFIKILNDDVDKHQMCRSNATMKSDELGLFLWVVKGEKIRYGFTSVSGDDLEYLEVPEFLKRPSTI